jgi:signal transduction histidine kinase
MPAKLTALPGPERPGPEPPLGTLAMLALSERWLDAGLAILDGQAAVTQINEPLANWLAEPAAELTGQPFWERLLAAAPEWAQTVRELSSPGPPFRQVNLQRTREGRLQCFSLELTTHAAGAMVRLNSSLPPLRELSETRWDEYLSDEASRQEMFMRLLRAEAQLENLVHRWPGVMFTQRPDFTFQFASSGIVELTGVPLAEWRRHAQRFWQVVHEADGDAVQQHIKRCVLERHGCAITFRIRHAQTGRVAYLLEHRQALVSAGGLVLGYEGVWLDVTRQMIAEKRLSSAAWKETLAVLTMGLAHDFSNIMAGILSLSESFLAQVDQGHPFREGLELIKHNSLQAHQLVHRIINLHHGKTGSSHYCDLNELVNELVDLVKKILPRRIQVATDLAASPLPIYVDPVEFRQVIINLTLNAAEAMPQGGTLRLQTSRQERLPDTAHLRGLRPRLPAVRLAVADTGCGIKPRHLASIFDPFFTTKPRNKGSGLGLYNTLLFVERHRGAVSVESVEGAGSTFGIWLPEADFTEAERALTPSARRRRSLLVVGRADGALEETAEFLRCHSYHVVTATSPAKALDLLESGDYQFVGLMVVAEARDLGLGALLVEVRRRKLPLTTMLQLVGCHPDEIDSHLLQKVDILIAPDLPESQILDLLSHTLAEPSDEPLPGP